MEFVFGGVQKDLDSTHLLRHSTSSSWILQNLITCLSMEALAISISYDQFFYLDALECSHSWCGYTVHITLTGYDASHQVRVLQPWEYHFWISPGWTTVCRLAPRGLKNFKSSPAVWGHRSGRWRRTLSLARWESRYGVETTTSGKHQWNAGWGGHFAYCTQVVKV